MKCGVQFPTLLSSIAHCLHRVLLIYRICNFFRYRTCVETGTTLVVGGVKCTAVMGSKLLLNYHRKAGNFKSPKIFYITPEMHTVLPCYKPSTEPLYM